MTGGFLGLLLGRFERRRDAEQMALLSSGLDPMMAAQAESRQPVRDFVRGKFESPESRVVSAHLRARRMVELQAALGNGGAYYPQPAAGGLVDAGTGAPVDGERFPILFPDSAPRRPAPAAPAPSYTQPLQPPRPGPAPRAQPPPLGVRMGGGRAEPRGGSDLDDLAERLREHEKRKAARTFDEPYIP